MKIKSGILFVLALAAFAFSQENYSSWSNYKVISVNTTSAGANVTGGVTNFPVLVRLTSANADIFSHASAGGADIRFTDSTGNVRLMHEKERWNVVGQVAEFWVLVPSIAGNAVTNFRIYWGKSGAADSSSSTSTFTRANNYVGVWHMGNPASNPVSDPRPNAVHPGINDAIPSTNEVVGFAPGYTVTQGQIGGADTLIGGASGTGGTAGTFTEGPYFDLGTITDTGFANFTKGMTISMWARIASVPNPSTSQYTRLAEISNGFNQDAISLDRDAGNANLRYEMNSNASGQTGTATGFWKADDIYHHVVITVTNSTTTDSVLMYLDGVASAPTTIPTLTTALENIQRTAGRFGCGTPSEDRESLTGALDEIEISNVNRSPSWIALSYQTQKTASTAVVLGSSLSTALPPSAPTAVTAVGGNAQATVSWTAATSQTAITGYTVTASDTSKHCATTGGTTCTVTGLANGTAYTFTVTSTNIAATSGPSAASNSVTPAAVTGAPGAPSGVVGTVGNAQIAVAWSNPSSDGGSAILGYTATSNPDGMTCTTTLGGLGCTVTGLTNGIPYTFTVVAMNLNGSGAASAPSAAVTPVGVPGVPSNVTATAGVASAVVSWASPTTNGGATITGYTVTSTPGSKTCTSTGAINCTVTGLSNGTGYTFTVTATNSAGTSAASAASASVTTPSAPGAPTITTVVGASGQVTVTWTAPTSTGGSAITGYTATATQDTSKHCTTTGLNCAVTGLTNTTSYTFTVKAINAVGAGTASATSSAVTGIQSFARDVNLHITGNSMSLNLPEISGSATVSIMDVWGRVVWSKTVGAGEHEVSWGRSSASGIAPGLYILRLTMQDSNHKPQIAAQSKILVTP